MAATIEVTLKTLDLYLLRKWKTATRPTAVYEGLMGFNEDFTGLEIYISSNGVMGWFVLNGCWNVAKRPIGILPGSSGYNYELKVKEWFTAENEWVI